METIKANAAFLCNYEVMQILQQLKDNTQKKHKREGSLATVTYETVRYLQETECKNQSLESTEKCLAALKPFKLTKTEKLMIVNTPPRTELEIQLIVQESEERLSEEEVKKIIDILEKYGGEKRSSLYPFDLETRAVVQERLYYDAGVFFVRLKVVALPSFLHGSAGASPKQLEDIDETYSTLENYLGRTRYLGADHLTIADLSMVSTASSILAIRPDDKDRFPKVSEWLERCEQEPCFAKVMRPGADLFGKLLHMFWEKNKEKSQNA